MLDADGNEDISEEEITSVLEADSEDPVIVEEGEIKDCFQPLYVTGTSSSTLSPSASVDTTGGAGDSTSEEDEESGETNDDDGDDG
jgi:hypothetical protein